jgi:tetratricopeptide (TPR) repeat protein
MRDPRSPVRRPPSRLLRALAPWALLLAWSPSLGCAAGALTPQAAGFNARGARLLARGALDAAEASLQLALEYDARFSEPHNNLGLVALARGRVDEARVHFRRAIARNEDFAEAWSNLGLALSRAGERDPADPSAAIEAFRHALSVDPGLVGPRVNLARALATLGRWTEALEQARRAALLAPREASIRALQAEAALALEAREEAEEASARAVSLAPFSGEAMFTRARVLAYGGRCGEAIALLERIAHDPLHGSSARALREAIARTRCP